MKLNKRATKIRKDLCKEFVDSPLMDVIADNLDRYETVLAIIEADGIYPDGKPHNLLNHIRSISQTITAAVKVATRKPVAAEQRTDTIADILAKRPTGGKCK